MRSQVRTLSRPPTFFPIFLLTLSMVV